MTQIEGSDLRTTLYRKVVRELVLWGLLVSSLANALLMVILLAAGAYEGGKACLMFFHLIPHSSSFLTHEQEAMALALKALEILLLAPLGYLFVSTFALFAVDLVEGHEGEWSRSLRALVGIKSLATGMLISIIAADLVGKVLQGVGLDTATTLLECLIFALLVLYLVVLEKSLSHSSQSSGRGENPESGAPDRNLGSH